jgi:hypothetical protein
VPGAPRYRFAWPRRGPPERPPAEPVVTAPVEQRQITLATHEDVQRELAVLFEAVTNGKLSAIEAVRRSRVLKSLAETMTAHSIERRLAAVEAASQVGKGKGR